MNDRAAFLAAVIAAPADDLPRLVFADWLDEQGDPRGEFIRVQCELERQFPGWRHCTIDPAISQCDYDTLRRRQRELWGRHSQQWWHGQFSFHHDATPRRGFVAEIQTTWAGFQRHAAALRAATPLEVVRLTTMPDIEPAGTFPFHIRLRGGRAAIHGEAAGDPVRSLLAAEYPGLRFELPASPTIAARGMPAVSASNDGGRTWGYPARPLNATGPP